MKRFPFSLVGACFPRLGAREISAHSAPQRAGCSTDGPPTGRSPTAPRRFSFARLASWTREGSKRVGVACERNGFGARRRPFVFAGTAPIDRAGANSGAGAEPDRRSPSLTTERTCRTDAVRGAPPPDGRREIAIRGHGGAEVIVAAVLWVLMVVVLVGRVVAGLIWPEAVF